MENIKKYITDDNRILSTGFKELDSKISGFKKKKLSLIASKVSHGKTAFILKSIVDHTKDNKNILYFSLDLTKEEMLTRMISIESKISQLAFSIPGVKAIEFGLGFNAAKTKGKEMLIQKILEVTILMLRLI